MATINNAEILGLDQVLGSIEKARSRTWPSSPSIPWQYVPFASRYLPFKLVGNERPSNHSCEDVNLNHARINAKKQDLITLNYVISMPLMQSFCAPRQGKLCACRLRKSLWRFFAPALWPAFRAILFPPYFWEGRHHNLRRDRQISL